MILTRKSFMQQFAYCNHEQDNYEIKYSCYNSSKNKLLKVLQKILKVHNQCSGDKGSRILFFVRGSSTNSNSLSNCETVILVNLKNCSSSLFLINWKRVWKWPFCFRCNNIGRTQYFRFVSFFFFFRNNCRIIVSKLTTTKVVLLTR